jgi:hypothetical protein
MSERLAERMLHLTADGRQSAAALDIQRGAIRLLRAHGFAGVPEVPLVNGRRADIVGLGERGVLWIVEIKSSLADFRADQKWPDYLDFADAFYFAVAPDFPVEVLPSDAGLIIADRWGGELARRGPEVRLPAPRRKAMTLRLARIAATRLSLALDPDAYARADAFET